MLALALVGCEARPSAEATYDQLVAAGVRYLDAQMEANRRVFRIDSYPRNEWSQGTGLLVPDSRTRDRVRAALWSHFPSQAGRFGRDDVTLQGCWGAADLLTAAFARQLAALLAGSTRDASPGPRDLAAGEAGRRPAARTRHGPAAAFHPDTWSQR